MAVSPFYVLGSPVGLFNVHLSHPTGADLLDDPVVTDLRVLGQGYKRLPTVVIRIICHHGQVTSFGHSQRHHSID